MQESAKAAMTYARSRARAFGYPPSFHKLVDIHIHVPEGAIPKDGPSAGVTMTTALVSALTGRPVKKDVAMTGEITLKGKVLPIGGIKEKVLAAHRAGIKTILLPRDNKKDVSEIPEHVRADLNLILVDNVDEVLKEAIDWKVNPTPPVELLEQSQPSHIPPDDED
jgi:ATP-dependent Lon protease